MLYGIYSTLFILSLRTFDTTSEMWVYGEGASNTSRPPAPTGFREDWQLSHGHMIV